jgi:hypothetical protein
MTHCIFAKMVYYVIRGRMYVFTIDLFKIKDDYNSAELGNLRGVY